MQNIINILTAYDDELQMDIREGTATSGQILEAAYNALASTVAEEEAAKAHYNRAKARLQAIQDFIGQD